MVITLLNSDTTVASIIIELQEVSASSRPVSELTNQMELAAEYGWGHLKIKPRYERGKKKDPCSCFLNAM